MIINIIFNNKLMNSEAIKQAEREAEWKKIEQMAKINAEKMESEINEPAMKTLIDNNLQG